MPLPKARAGRAVVSQVFEDLEFLIRGISLRFARKYNRDFQETYQEACYQFLKAYHTHDPEKGILETRVQFVVWNRLLDRTRREAIEAIRLPRALTVSEMTKFDGYNAGVADDTDVGASRSVRASSEVVANQGRWQPDPFDRDALGSVESEDAQFLICLMLDTPDELAEAIRNDPKPNERNTREHLKRHLAGLGWDRDRIGRAFADAEEIVAVI